MLKQGSPTQNQSGQAVLEYILLLVITLSLIGGILYQFNDAFARYADRMFGRDSYLSCIIMNGILPDGESSGVDCSKPRFNLADGKPQPGNSSNDKDNSSQKSPSAENSNPSKNNAGTASQSAGSDRGSKDSSLIPMSSGEMKKLGVQNSQEKSSVPKDSTGNTGFSSANVSQSDNNSSGKGASEIPLNNGRRGLNKNENLNEKSSTSVPVTTRDMKSAREIALEKAKRKAAAQNEGGLDLNFNTVFKMLIIVALIFGIIFFVGSQVLAVSRSKNRK